MVTEFDVVPTIIGILFLVLPALLLGRLCSHYKIPEIIGFVFAGIILGPTALGGVVPIFGRPIVELNEVMMALWQISGIIILFSAGLHFTFHDLIKAGYKSALIGVFGVLIPLLLGYLITIWLNFDWTVAVIIGTTLSATSIAISVVILEEIGKEKSKEGNILVNAAVLDDVLGLAILSAIISLVALNTSPSIESIAITTVTEIGFWFLILLGSVYLLPKIVHAVAQMSPRTLEARATKQGVALGSAFGLAAIAASVGLNPIVGAFAAGMGLAGSKLARQVREFVDRLKIIVAPLFFAVIGAHVDLSQISSINWILFLILLGIAVFSKIIGCGIPAAILLKSKKSGLRIGYGMIPRGEVAFIVAGIGLAFGVISDVLYSTIVFVIMATIFIAPILVRNSFQDKKALTK
ncbi:MAG: cation:proton antiporter [Nitrosopumilaceae archaeon]|uniref:Cation:proton antiporter n=2 Tax=Candidatus Nitrosomaritimum aestuariumsis TaxID=3342354 RepID=A0AC60WAB5_9ARCH|nr:cation:proton antiporter [Nitrosopumilaceae archaeon]MBA4459884.1 cation:proton antiporter [Nitrosopumilaceae archaeon]MBA4461647.1 cation:proton antiporter [Nitrosopumilaceae archaeon]MBA4464095.1 cation:proton antiporter [Nitrosopumilaceae archaeon]